MIVFLFSTSCRRGEALGVQWSDVDFERRRVTIRRSIRQREVTTPKSGRSRAVGLPDTPAAELRDLLAARRRDTLARGWREIPEWIFCSEAATSWDKNNVEKR